MEPFFVFVSVGDFQQIQLAGIQQSPQQPQSITLRSNQIAAVQQDRFTSFQQPQVTALSQARIPNQAMQSVGQSDRKNYMEAEQTGTNSIRPPRFRARFPRDNFGNSSVLKGLSRGRLITIKWKRNANSEAEVLMSDFPKQLAIHFSEAWAQLFPYQPGKSARQAIAAHPKTITIIGGQLEAHLIILKWMRDCTNGNGLQPWYEYTFGDKPFYRYYHLRRSAQIIGCGFLQDEFHERIQALSNKRIHSDDVAALWEKVPINSEMAAHLVDHVASFFVDKGPYHNVGPYMRLRQAYPDFDNAIIARIGFRYDRDPELARAWNSRNLAKDMVEGETFLASMNVDEAVEEDGAGEAGGEVTNAAKDMVTDASKDDVTQAAKEKVTVAAKAFVGVDLLEQAHHEASKIKNKAARRREKRRLAKAAAGAPAG